MSSITIGLIVLACVFGGALLGIFLHAVLPQHHLSSETKDIVKLGVGLVGTMAAHVAERALGGHDPGAIVVDEVAGMLVPVLLAPSRPVILLMGFLLFRLFDIWKPFPIRQLEANLKGGLGVMADDLVAACYAYVVFAIVVIVAYKGFGFE